MFNQPRKQQKTLPTASSANIYSLAIMSLMTALTCILAPFSIPIGPVPISLTHLALYLSLYLLGWKSGTISYLMYLLLGALGLPVFSGFSGGLGKLFGPTGGYLFGTIFLAAFAGFFIQKSTHRLLHFFAMSTGMLLCYTAGTIWFCQVTQTPFYTALGLCVFPFLPADFLKIILALLFGPKLRARLRHAGQLPS